MTRNACFSLRSAIHRSAISCWREWIKRAASAGLVCIGAGALAAQDVSPAQPWANNPLNRGNFGPTAVNPQQGMPVAPTSPQRPAGWPGSAPAQPPGPPPQYPDPRAPVGPGGYPTGPAAYRPPQNPPYAPPGQAPAAGAPPQANQPAPAPVRDPLETGLFDGATILARVGTEVILASEILPTINEQLARAGDRFEPDEVNAFRVQQLKVKLAELIETKLIIADAKRKIPAENLKKMEDKFNGDEFEKNQLRRMMESAKCASRQDLDLKLRKLGSSVDSQRRALFERYLSLGWEGQQQEKKVEEITHEDMLAWYKGHIAQFEFPAKVRWEHIMIKFRKYDTKEEAYRHLAQCGNQILAGAPLAEIARAHSHDLSSEEGGVQDWTTQGSLVSTVLDEALFSLPVGKLSQILEDAQGFHIVRVTERQEQTRTAFVDAQPEIRKHLKEERTVDDKKVFRKKLRETTPIWTIFDEKPSGLAARPSGTMR